MIYVVMGVSGSGKSTIGKMLAQELLIPFKDADDYHPSKNIEKMSQSIPLNDDDRKDWLLLLSNNMIDWQSHHPGVVLACSALKQQYRELLIQSSQLEIKFIYLKGSYQLIQKRLDQRKNHFMCKNLLKSQFDTLEEPKDAITVSLELNPRQQLKDILEKMTCKM